MKTVKTFEASQIQAMRRAGKLGIYFYGARRYDNYLELERMTMIISYLYMFLAASVFIGLMIWNIRDKQSKIKQNRGLKITKQFSILSSIIVISALLLFLIYFFIVSFSR